MIDVQKAAPGNEVVRLWYITDWDRIGGTMHGSREEADQSAADLARKYPGNAVYVLEAVVAFKRPRDRDHVLDLGFLSPAQMTASQPETAAEKQRRQFEDAEREWDEIEMPGGFP